MSCMACCRSFWKFDEAAAMAESALDAMVERGLGLRACYGDGPGWQPGWASGLAAQRCETTGCNSAGMGC